MMLKKTIATAGTAGLLTAGSFGMAAPAQAAPLFTGGLVNVTITDTLNDNNILNDVTVIVAIPVGVAANVCGTSVAILGASAVSGPFNCTASTVQDLPIAFQGRR